MVFVNLEILILMLSQFPLTFLLAQRGCFFSSHNFWHFWYWLGRFLWFSIWMILLLLPSFVSGSRGSDEYFPVTRIWSGLVHRHGFQLLDAAFAHKKVFLLSVPLKQIFCLQGLILNSKSLLKKIFLLSARHTYANKIRESMTAQKLGSRDFGPSANCANFSKFPKFSKFLLFFF